MGSPEKPIDVELGNLDPEIHRNGDKKDEESAMLGQSKVSSEPDRFTGLKKEELMEIANQPRWRRARLVLFILFWILWVGMLAAAILIVINAPKCKPKPDTEWYQDTVLYKVDPANYDKDYKGMADHMRYIKDLKTSLLLSNVMGDDMMKAKGEEKSFNNLVEKAHESNIKVVVELDIDSMSLSSSSFASAKSCNLKNATKTCKLFRWSNSAESSSGYIERSGSSEMYQGDASKAALNYNSDLTTKYLQSVMDKWLGRKVDGFMIGDLSKVQQNGFDAGKVVKTAWDKVQDKSDEDTKYGLFVAASSESDVLSLSKAYSVDKNSSVTLPHPVIMYNTFPQTTKPNPTSLQDNVLQHRDNARVFYALNNMAKLSDESEQSLGLTLINIALPGVTILHSGDELGSRSLYQKMTWADNQGTPSNKPEALSSRGDKEAKTQHPYKQVVNLIKKKTADTLSKESLRYDTQDESSEFKFLTTNSTKVGAFCRRWYNKPSVLVVYNTDPQPQQNIKIDFKSCDPNFENGVSVLVSSSKQKELASGESLKIENFNKIPSYVTMVLTTN